VARATRGGGARAKRTSVNAATASFQLEADMALLPRALAACAAAAASEEAMAQDERYAHCAA